MMVSRLGVLVILTLCTLMQAGCAVYSRQFSLPSPARVIDERSASEPQSLFVFFDGTSNTPGSETNVWRLFDLVERSGSPNTKAFYMEGVGNSRNRVSGMVLGFGMERRIREGYRFLAENFRPGDAIYIFGFSRGAHQARALAGLIAYSGIPQLEEAELGDFRRIGNHIIERTKKVEGREVAEDSQGRTFRPWDGWSHEAGPLLGKEFEGHEMLAAEVTFLGVWDTVPGSLLKGFAPGQCIEPREGPPGDRYKSGSYPPIRVIAHAVARDEKRGRFEPLLLCEPIDKSRTKVHERWFPGVHSDVGGGYDDAGSYKGRQSLANFSFNWMTELLAEQYRFSVEPPVYSTDPTALAHWPVAGFAGRLMGGCRDRLVPEEAGKNDPAVAARASAQDAPLLVKDAVVCPAHPLTCAGRNAIHHAKCPDP